MSQTYPSHFFMGLTFSGVGKVQFFALFLMLTNRNSNLNFSSTLNLNITEVLLNFRISISHFNLSDFKHGILERHSTFG